MNILRFYIILWILNFLCFFIFGANCTTSYPFNAFLSLIILYKWEWFLIKAFIWNNFFITFILNYRQLFLVKKVVLNLIASSLNLLFLILNQWTLSIFIKVPPLSHFYIHVRIILILELHLIICVFTLDIYTLFVKILNLYCKHF